MRLAAFSDIHGNPYACRALLAALKQEGHFDALLALGDLCLGDSDPAGTLDMLRDADVLAVYGNTEEYLANEDYVPPDEHHASQWEVLQPIVRWTGAQLSAEQHAWLGALPFRRRFSPGGDGSDLVAVHANPLNCEIMLYPAAEQQTAIWGSLRQPDDDPELLQALSGFDSPALVFGHLHTPGRRTWQGVDLINVAAVSLPSIDHDAAVRYSILTWDGSGAGRRAWNVERRRVAYDVRQEISALACCGMPGYTRFSRTYE